MLSAGTLTGDKIRTPQGEDPLAFDYIRHYARWTDLRKHN